jgi:hypothetical protein
MPQSQKTDFGTISDARTWHKQFGLQVDIATKLVELTALAPRLYSHP